MDKATILYNKLYAAKDPMTKEAFMATVSKGLSLALKGAKAAGKIGLRGAKASYKPTKNFLTKNPFGKFVGGMAAWTAGPAMAQGMYGKAHGRTAGKALQNYGRRGSGKLNPRQFNRDPMRTSSQFNSIKGNSIAVGNANTGVY